MNGIDGSFILYSNEFYWLTTIKDFYPYPTGHLKGLCDTSLAAWYVKLYHTTGVYKLVIRSIYVKYNTQNSARRNGYTDYFASLTYNREV